MNLNKKGVALILVLILVMAIAVIVGGFLYGINVNQRFVYQKVNRVRTFYIAEAGINKAIYYLAYTAPDSSTDGSWRTTAYPADPGEGVADPQQEIFDDGNYTMWVESAGSNVLIRSRGMSNNISRTISVEVVLTPASPNIVTTVEDTWKEI